ncbi:M15 family metallopeptidase [Streptococcus cuniculipharyngis]|uniref:D-alanyl-D-alanine carboxypeptidase family protein n=1 Tax=Streptococcus cuniculipharyngis TaxID=1562651 RepID=A0A5C5S8T3_9STRE|nr:D-alanyl-D-alanine carboxypeptidase family protein [Streptococcus cuniculipharyngis]
MGKGLNLKCIGLIVGVLLLLLLLVKGVFLKTDNAQMPESTVKSERLADSNDKEESDLPKVSSADWELRLVNRNHYTPELNPDLAMVDNIWVDRRIEDQVRGFLEAAQAIDANEHLISGYRSVAYQEELYESYVEQEMAANPDLSRAAAERLVQTYSQPAGASEHQTGLAIDMSTVNSLNASDPEVARQVQDLAADYGFVLRFPQGKAKVTGVDYEDWHFRYVGVQSANYMKKNQLTLEEYVNLLKENNQ